METQEIIKKLSELGVSQFEMAEKSGISQGRISQILSNGGDCSFTAGLKLRDLLKGLAPVNGKEAI